MRHIPADHLLRSIDRFVDLSELRRDLAPFYSSMDRPSVDPELMIRMLIIGCCVGIRSKRRLCEEVHLNLALAAQAERWRINQQNPGFGARASSHLRRYTVGQTLLLPAGEAAHLARSGIVKIVPQE